MSSWSAPRRPRRGSRAVFFRRPNLEELERRDLPDATGVMAPLLDATPLAYTSPFPVYTPGQVRHAYGFDRVPYTGAGQTIAIVTAYNDPNIFGDVAAFDAQFGLPGRTSAQVAGFLTRVSQSGSTTALPAASTAWALETSLDVEWAHAIAPQARILLVEASSSGGDLLTAVNYARSQPGVSVVSMSWGSAEFSGEAGYDGFFTTPAGHTGVTFVAAAGDSGAAHGPEWPSVSPNVVAVGGTTLRLTGNSLRSSETAWSDGGGGVASQEAEPAYQRGVQASGRRETPDVAYDADPATGVYVFDSYGLARGQTGWYDIGGTSAGAPQWAGLFALVDQARAWTGRAPIGDPHTALYALPASAFYDVTSGSNPYRAGPGFDLATGRGSPVADQIIADLITAPVGTSSAGAAGTSGAGRSGARAVPQGGTAQPDVDPALLSQAAGASAVGDAVFSRPDFAARPPGTPLDVLAAEQVRQKASDPMRRQTELSGGGNDAVWEAETDGAVTAVP